MAGKGNFTDEGLSKLKTGIRKSSKKKMSFNDKFKNLIDHQKGNKKSYGNLPVDFS